MKLKLKKKIVIPILAAVVAAAIFVPQIVSAMNPKLPEVSATPIARTDLANTVSVTGTVKSIDATNVYSTLTYQVKQVNVSVGDVVKEGDVLCELDASDLTAAIDRESATLSQNQAKAQHNLAVAQNNLETEKYNQEYNFDEQLASAESAVERAKQALETARLNLRSAEVDLTAARKDYQGYQDETGNDSSTYDEIEISKRNRVRQGELTVTQRENDVEEATKALEDAKANLKTVKVQKQEAIISGEQQVTTARLNANLTDQKMQIDELRKDLEDTVITAPVSGTITAVMAKQGSPGQGLLFVIEDTDKLRIDTKIKEYDMVSVATGQIVKIKADGTGDDEYEGMVSKIAPTAVKSAQGDTVETTDAQFEVEIGVTGSTKLKIGMNARVEIITEEKRDVFAVSYDAVVPNESGEQIVYVARPKSAGGEEGGEAAATAGNTAETGKKQGTDENVFIAVAVPVTTGLETDFYVEISSDGLHEGDLVISDPSALTDGDEIRLTDAFGGAMGGGAGGPGVQVRMG